MPDPLAVLPEELCARIFLATARPGEFFSRPSPLWEATRLQSDGYHIATNERLRLLDGQPGSDDPVKFLEARTGAQAWLARRAPSFKKLQIRVGSMKGVSFRLIWQRCMRGLRGSNLKVLVILTDQDQADDFTIAAISSLATLEVLRIDNLGGSISKALLRLHRLHNLQELFMLFPYSPDTGKENFCEAFRGLTGLRKLALDGFFGSLTTKILFSLTVLKNLEELDISAMIVSELNLASLSKLSALHCTYQSPEDRREPDPEFLLPLSLTRLVLTCCPLMPPAMAQCTSLRFLWLYQVSLRHPLEFDDIVGNLRNLERLDLDRCSIDRLPPAVAALPKLKALKICDCHFDPDAFGGSPLLPRLEALSLEMGEPILHSISAARDLKYLAISPSHDLGDAEAKVIQSLPSLKEVFRPSSRRPHPSKTLLEICQQRRPDVRFHLGRCQPEKDKIPGLLDPAVEPSERYQF